MIKNVRIKNFKCFGPAGVDFDLSKVNFIFGDNSSGKSSLLQFLEWVGCVVRNPKEKGMALLVDLLQRTYCGQCKDLPGLPVKTLQGVDLSGLEKTVKEKWNSSLGRYISGAIRCCDANMAETGMIICPLGDYYRVCGVKSALSSEGSIGLVSEEEYARLGAFVVHQEAGRDAKGYHTISLSINEFEKLAVEMSPAEKLEHEREMPQIIAASDRKIRYINNFLSRIGLEYECVRWCDGTFDSMKINDKILSVESKLENVGTGIQRLFGMAERFADWQDGILAIEEPESNVNERQMAALTQTMVEEALKHQNAQLIVECHSKIVALQLAALVRKGVLTMNGPDANLSVMEVTKTPKGSEVNAVRISPAGDITWPTGFFPAEGSILRDMYGA